MITTKKDYIDSHNKNNMLAIALKATDWDDAKIIEIVGGLDAPHNPNQNQKKRKTL